MTHTWSDIHPEGCPPEDAQDAGGAFFRFVKNDPPTPEDFIRPIEKPRAEEPPDDQICGLCALSLLQEEADVQLFIKYVPGMRKKKVAKGVLRTEMGVILKTPAPIIIEGGQTTLAISHHDWWVPEAYTDTPGFEVVEI